MTSLWNVPRRGLSLVVYAKLDWFSDIRKKARISDIRNNFLISEVRAYFLISENDFLILENRCDILISEIRVFSDIRNSIFWYQKFFFWYEKLFSDIRNSDFFISENHFWYEKFEFLIRKSFSDIRKSFSDIRKSALKSYLVFHTVLKIVFSIKCQETLNLTCFAKVNLCKH